MFYRFHFVENHQKLKFLGTKFHILIQRKCLFSGKNKIRRNIDGKCEKNLNKFQKICF